MPKRKSVKKHDASEVQGEGAFVVTTAVKVKEIREIRRLAKTDDFDEFEGGVSMLAKHIIDWNFVDDEGKPLPVPKDRPEVVDELTNEESEFLAELLMGEQGKSKNSNSGS